MKMGGEKKEILGAFLPPLPFFLSPSLPRWLERIKKGRWGEEVCTFLVIYFFKVFSSQKEPNNY